MLSLAMLRIWPVNRPLKLEVPLSAANWWFLLTPALVRIRAKSAALSAQALSV
jgi:hypothetical protein